MKFPATALCSMMMAVLPWASSLALATTYRWVDADGVVHYSDKPQPGAAKVDLPPAQTYTTPAAGKAPAAPLPPAAAIADPMSCSLTEPVAEQTFVNVYAVTINATGPAGGEARLMLDGGVKMKAPSGNFVVSPIDRGTHRAYVIFSGIGGGELCRTDPVTFYVRQNSVNRPAQIKRKK